MFNIARLKKYRNSKLSSSSSKIKAGNYNGSNRDHINALKLLYFTAIPTEQCIKKLATYFWRVFQAKVTDISWH